LPDETATERYESYIGRECETEKKYAVLGSFGHLLPAKILNDDFSHIAKILRSGYFAKKVDGDDTKVWRYVLSSLSSLSAPRNNIINIITKLSTRPQHHPRP
jgi:hypothetical protein